MTSKASTNIMRVFFVFLLLAFPALAADDHPGKRVFEKGKCAVCHGADGSADTPAGKNLGARDLRSNEVQKMTDGELATIIRDGGDKMPAYGKTFDDAEIARLVSYIRHLATR